MDKGAKMGGWRRVGGIDVCYFFFREVIEWEQWGEKNSSRGD